MSKVISFNKLKPKVQPQVLGAMHRQMRATLGSGSFSLEESIRMAKTLAPILKDKTNNKNNISLITSPAPMKEKVIATVLLGFRGNREVLPFLQTILRGKTESLAMAAAVAISQMKEKDNNKILIDILLSARNHHKNSQIKKACKNAIVALLDKSHRDLFISLNNCK